MAYIDAELVHIVTNSYAVSFSIKTSFCETNNISSAKKTQN